MMRLIILTFAIILSGCMATNHGPTTSDQANPKYQTYIQSGDIFPLTTATDITGKAIALNSPKQKKLILLFATWCHDSQRTIRHILASELVNDPNLKIVAFGREETIASLQKFKKQFKVNFTLVADPQRTVYDQFANTGLPRLLLINPDNTVAKTLVGEDQRTIDRIIW